MTRAGAAVRCLNEAADSGDLSDLCARRHVDLMVLFGSAARSDPQAADVDIAVRFAHMAEDDQLAVLDDLYRLTGFEGFDLLVLNRAGPLARERAMVGGRLLFQKAPGLFANEQIAALMQRMDTDQMRRVELELMAP